MKCIGIVTDSHGGISPEEAKNLGVMVMPMPFYVGDRCCYEGVDLSREEFMNCLTAGESVSTSQPSPQTVVNTWREALKEYESILYLPLSSGLSGACTFAKVLALDEEFKNRVYVVDNGRISTPMHRAILDALELIEKGCSVSDIKDQLEANGAEMSIYIAVETLEYLKKGGRITPAVAALGSVLNIKPILSLNTGKLDQYKKCRGMKKAKKEMLAAIQKDLETKFAAPYQEGKIHLLAATSADEETTAAWLNEIKEEFPNMEILCDPLSFGIACHTGPGALGIGISVSVL
ncbi:MAG: DegV family protein [Firmicutes bacterium]|nr:DegV family protein [Bacillota bacterium]